MTFRALLAQVVGRLLAGDARNPVFGATLDESLAILESGDDDLTALLDAADRVRRHYLGNRVRLCAILNAKSGDCPEDCAFCAQSAHHAADAPRHRLVTPETAHQAARGAVCAGAGEFSLVTSGLGPGDGEVAALADAVRAVASAGIAPCASLGIVGEGGLRTLREAGLTRLHHNLEAARSFYPAVCTTRDYDDNVRAVRAAKGAGLPVCCGGIFGLGETLRQRAELLTEIAALAVDSVPINFLNPIKGTPLAGRPLVPPLDALRILSAARLAMPATHVVVCGGREATLGEFQALVFFAGASGLLIGDYLTTKGRSAAEDLRLVAALGLAVETP
jgi:biotin synthase